MQYKNIGIWIDHHKAVIVKIDEWGAADVTEIYSGVSDKHRSTGGVRSNRPFFHRSVFSGKHQAAARGNELKSYYASIMPQLTDATKLWVFGPSTARQELLTFLKENGSLRGVELDEPSAYLNRVSQEQIIEHVRTHFHKSLPRIHPTFAGQPFDG